RAPVREWVAAGRPPVGPVGRSGLGMQGTSGGQGDGAANGSSNGSLPDSGRAAVTLSKLRWSVAAEALTASAVLAVTAVLVNTPTARETFTRPASAAVGFNTGGPGGGGHRGGPVAPARPRRN